MRLPYLRGRCNVGGGSVLVALVVLESLLARAARSARATGLQKLDGTEADGTHVTVRPEEKCVGR